MEVTENTFRYVEHEVRENLKAVSIDLMGAINEIVLTNIWELLSEA